MVFSFTDIPIPTVIDENLPFFITFLICFATFFPKIPSWQSNGMDISSIKFASTISFIHWGTAAVVSPAPALVDAFDAIITAPDFPTDPPIMRL